MPGNESSLRGVAYNIERDTLASIETYEQHSVGVRRAGILSPERTYDALLDPRTIKFESSERDGDVALFVPLEYGDGLGYDVSRCEKTIIPNKDTSTFIYLSTGNMLMTATDNGYANIISQLKSHDELYVFFSQSNMIQEGATAEEELKRLMSDSEYLIEEIPLVDDDFKMASERTTTASISLYALNLPKNPEGRAICSPVDFFNEYHKGIEEGAFDYDVVSGVVLAWGNHIHPDLLDKMWAIYTNRFQWLGQNHPISMEDTREDFENIFCSENTILSISFKDSEPVCFSGFVHDLDCLYWLDSNFLKECSMGDGQDRANFFFPGIVASGQGSNHSQKVIGLLSEVAKRTGGAYRVFFENTNRSKQYIPRIVRSAIVNTGIDIDMPERLDETDYRLLHIRSRL